MYVFIGNVQKNLNAHGGCTPAAVVPPNAITPEQVIRHHRYKRRGDLGGLVLSPPLLYQYVVVHIKSKRNSPELISLYYLLY